MKFCAIICEFNPFHNGHKYIIERARELSGCDGVLCIMSGCFTQRGEMCVNDKFIRAKHAVSGGADAVIELPTPFAVAPAEIFAKGAIKILSAIPEVTALAFGCEGCEPSGSCEDGEEFENAAKILCNESDEFKSALNEGLDGGESYIRSLAAAFEKCGGAEGLLSSPNNILGVEYAKAVLQSGKVIKLLPVKRVGGGYLDGELCGEFSSASAIRLHSTAPEIKTAMPDFSFNDFSNSADNTARFERLAVDWLYMCDKENLKRVYGCTEGLENRLKNIAFGHSYAEIVGLASSKRYSKARIQRILAANLLGLYADETEEFLKADLKPKILAVKKERADELLPHLSPVVKSVTDPITEKCEEITSHAYSLWRYLNTPLSYENEREKMILV